MGEGTKNIEFIYFSHSCMRETKISLGIKNLYNIRTFCKQYFICIMLDSENSREFKTDDDVCME